LAARMNREIAFTGIAMAAVISRVALQDIEPAI
jgi:hypothetical protein